MVSGLQYESLIERGGWVDLGSGFISQYLKSMFPRTWNMLIYSFSITTVGGAVPPGSGNSRCQKTSELEKDKDNITQLRVVS